MFSWKRRKQNFIESWKKKYKLFEQLQYFKCCWEGKKNNLCLCLPYDLWHISMIQLWLLLQPETSMRNSQSPGSLLHRGHMEWDADIALGTNTHQLGGQCCEAVLHSLSELQLKLQVRCYQHSGHTAFIQTSWCYYRSFLPTAPWLARP